MSASNLLAIMVCEHCPVSSGLVATDFGRESTVTGYTWIYLGSVLLPVTVGKTCITILEISACNQATIIVHTYCFSMRIPKIYRRLTDRPTVR